MKGLILIVFVFVTSVLAQNEKNCGIDIMVENFNCINEFNPCDFEAYQIKFKPKVAYLDPFNENTHIVPSSIGELGSTGYSPQILEDEMCTGHKGYLKPEWALYDRKLELADLNYTAEIDNEQIRKLPWRFSVYNKKTGILRTFIWIGEAYNLDGQNLIIQEYLGGDKPVVGFVTANGLNSIMTGNNTALPISASLVETNDSKMNVYSFASQGNFWIVLDKSISYDPWMRTINDEGTQSIRDVQNSLFYLIKVEKIVDLKIEGEMLTKDITEPGEGGSPIGRLLGTKAISAQMSGGKIGSASTFTLDPHALGKISGAIHDMFGATDGKMDDWGLDKIANLGFAVGSGNVMPMVATSLFGKSKPRTYTFSQIKLGGTLSEVKPVDVVSTPMPDNQGTPPFFSRKKTKQDADGNVVADESAEIKDKIGLFSLVAPPKVTVQKVPYRKRWIKQKYRDDILLDSTDRYAYFISIDDPTCDLAINPNVQSNFRRLLVRPTYGENGELTALGKVRLRDLQPAINYQSQLWVTDDQSDFFGPKNDATTKEIGVDVYTEFVADGEPIVQEAIFPAEVTFLSSPMQIFDVGDEKDESVESRLTQPKVITPRTCTVTGNKPNVDVRDAKQRNVVTRFSITTGTGKGASTDGDVWATIKGCDGREESFVLDNRSKDDFQGGEDHFIQTSFINHGPMQWVKFTLGGKNTSWHLGKFTVEQVDLATGEQIGSMEKEPYEWLYGNGTNSKMYTATNVNCMASEYANSDEYGKYSVEVTSSDLTDAGTANSLALQFCGMRMNDDMYDCYLVPLSSGIKRGETKVIETGEIIKFKSIQSIKLSLNGSDGVRIDDVEIIENPDKVPEKVVYSFGIRQWIDNSASISRIFKKGMSYDFEVKTADEVNAGTDAAIYAKLCDKSGAQCVSFKLDNTSEDDNEQGATNTYKFYSETVLPNLGSLTLYNDLSDNKPGWKPYSVKVTAQDLTKPTPSVETQSYWFDQWLADGEARGDVDTKDFTSEALTLGDRTSGASVTVKSGIKSVRDADANLKYSFTVNTKDKDDAGTNSKVWAVVENCNGMMEYFRLDNVNNNFEQAAEDAFSTFRNFNPTKDYRIKSLTIMHDGSGNKPNWWLERVRLSITNPNDPDNDVDTYDNNWDQWIGNGKTNNQTFTYNGKTYYGVQKSTNTCATSQSIVITGISQNENKFSMGAVIDVGGVLLGGDASMWSATLGGQPLAIRKVSASRMLLDIPEEQPLGSQTLTVKNVTKSVEWSTNVTVEWPTPSATAISHVSRKEGEYFEILGANFGEDETAIEVKLGNLVMPLARLMDGRISLMVPQGTPAGTYQVSTTVHGKTAPQVYTLEIEALAPAISKAGPSSLSPGETITISGSGFGVDLSDIQVLLGGANLSVSSVSVSQIKAVVPAGFASGKYAVKVIRDGVSSNTDKVVEVLTMPSFLDFDSPTQVWYSNETSVSRDPTKVSANSTASLAIQGENYRVIRSPRFNTTDFGKFSEKLALDLYIPATVSNPSWLGEVALFIDIPAAGVNNVWQSKVDLSGKAVGRWHTLYFPINAQAFQAIAGDFPNMEIAIVLNAGSTTEPYRIDELRFVDPNLQYRTVQHVAASRHLNVVVPAKLGFEESDPWLVPGIAAAQYITEPREEGATAMQVNASGFMHFVSPELRAFELSIATKDVNVDVYVPDPQPNQWWVGNIGAYVDCPYDGIYNQSIGQKDLTHLFRMEYNSVRFEIPDALLPRMKSSIGGCRFFVDLNVSNGPAPFILDKMGFVYPDGEVVVIPTEPSSSSSSSNGSSSTTGSSSSSGFACTGMCVDALVASTQYIPYTLGTTSEVWYVMDRIPQGWQANEMAGRTISVNGVAVTAGQMNWPAAVNGKWYIQFSAGAHSWATWSWW